MTKQKSQRPRAARRRLRENTERLEDEIMSDIATVYEKPVEEWDWEELSHGRPRSERGYFDGRKPSWITPAITAEARRRMRTLTEDELMVHAGTAINVLKDIMTNSEQDDFGKPVVPASVRVDAAKYVLNHIIGTPKARVEVNETNPIRDMMADVLVNPDGEASHMVIDMPGDADDDDEEEGD